MKATKKIVSITLALVLVALAFVMPASAAKAYPLIVVDGFASAELYKNVGTEDETPAFDTSEASAQAMGTEIGTAFVAGFIYAGFSSQYKDYNKMADVLFPVVNKYLADFGYNTDGTPMNDTVGVKKTDKSMSEYSEEEQAEFSVFAQEYAKKYGAQNVYTFSYDWRADPIEIAEEFAAYVEMVKAQTGYKKVNVVAHSMGANILLCYMSANGGKSLNNVVFTSPAWQGTSLAGSVFTGDIELADFSLENYLVQLGNINFFTHVIAFVISYIASDEGLGAEEYTPSIDFFIQQLLPRAYSDTIIPYIAGMPGIWSLVPADYYEDAKEFLFPDGMDASLEAKIKAYHEIQTNAEQIITDAMADGMRFGIVCGYNCQMIPINDGYEQSDTIIDVKYMSGGATCSDYLQAYDDWGNIYTQAVKDDHNHVSWDYKVDASTSMFREQVWFIKNMQHNEFSAETGTVNVVMWLLDADDQYDVHTDENYPQFSLYNTYKKVTTPVNVEYGIGDVNQSGAVTGADARLALQFASGIATPTEDQLILGDMDEDGEFSTEDARVILCMAVGIAAY